MDDSQGSAARAGAPTLAIAIAIGAAFAPDRAEAESGGETSAADAIPFAEHFEAGLGGEARWMRDRGARAVSGGGPSGLVAISGGVGLGVIERVGELSVDLSWARGTASDAIFQDVSTDLALEYAIASVRLSRPIGPRGSAFARAGAGARHLRLELQSADSSIRDTSLGALGVGSAGVDVFPFRGDAASRIGLRAELGYALERSHELRAEPASENGDDAHAIPAEAATLGRLEAGGPFLRVALMARF